jgi:hypothetical protein
VNNNVALNLIEAPSDGIVRKVNEPKLFHLTLVIKEYEMVFPAE